MRADTHAPIPVSVIVMTRNHEANIAKCLDSLRRFAEVFVVDSNSADETRGIATREGAIVVPFTWNGAYPKKKQWSLDNVPFTYDWVLFLDVDEEVTPELADEVAALMAAGPSKAAYFAGYDYVFAGRVLKHGHRVYKLVLLDRRRAQFREQDDLDLANPVEVELHFQPTIDGETGVLRSRLIHDDHASLFQYLARHNSYSDWEARLRTRGDLPVKDEAQPPLRAPLKAAFARLPAKAALAFLYSYVVKLGFLDGRAGFHFAVARAFYYWQIGLKMRELEQREKQGSAQ